MMISASAIGFERFGEDIERDGYAIVEHVLSDSMIEPLRSAIASIRTGEEVRRKRNIYGVRNLLEICPAVVRLAGLPEVRRFVVPMLGERCFAVRAIFFDKVEGANWKLGWHQDSVISVRERKEVPGFVGWSPKAGVWQVRPTAEVLAGMLAIRLHLDDCDRTNGPLRVLPGSHAHGWLDDELDAWKRRVPEVVCEVGTGGIVAMRPLLLHASAPAERPSNRRVIHIEFANSDLPGGLEWKNRVGAADLSDIMKEAV